MMVVCVICNHTTVLRNLSQFRSALTVTDDNSQQPTVAHRCHRWPSGACVHYHAEFTPNE